MAVQQDLNHYEKTNLLPIAAWFLLFAITRQRQIERDKIIFGPDPAIVRFETYGGMKGTIAVRDRKNANSEVQEYVKNIVINLQKTPGVAVKGDIESSTKVKSIEIVESQ